MVTGAGIELIPPAYRMGGAFDHEGLFVVYRSAFLNSRPLVAPVPRPSGLSDKGTLGAPQPWRETGLFDDLVPGQPQPAQPTGLFDDLIPGATFPENLTCMPSLPLLAGLTTAMIALLGERSRQLSGRCQVARRPIPRPRGNLLNLLIRMLRMPSVKSSIRAMRRGWMFAAVPMLVGIGASHLVSAGFDPVRLTCISATSPASARALAACSGTSSGQAGLGAAVICLAWMLIRRR